MYEWKGTRLTSERMAVLAESDARLDSEGDCITRPRKSARFKRYLDEIPGRSLVMFGMT